MKKLTIRDVIHGNIHLSDIETKIIDTPYFQRLRDIKQLGFLSFIFPSATHSRFEHSIGTMHLMEELIRKIAFNQSKLLFNTPFFLSPSNSRLLNQKMFEQIHFSEDTQISSSIQNISMTEYKERIELLLNEKLIKILRLSALLHDVGHGPYSHASEFLLASVSINSLEKLSIPSFLKDFFRKELKNGESVSHEWVSAIISSYIFNDLNLDISLLQDTLSVILKEIPPSKGSILENNNIIFFVRTLLSGECDADRMDYLLRDSYYTGVNYGLFDLHRILDSFYFFIDQNKNLHLALHSHGLLSFEDYLFRRYQMYTQIYMHRTNACLEELLSRLCKKWPLDTYPLTEKNWLTFNDYTFRDYLKKYLSKNSENLNLLEEIFTRKSWKIIFEEIGILHSPNSVFPSYLKKLEKTNMSDHYFTQSSTLHLSHLIQKEKKIKILELNHISNLYEFKDIEENSYLFQSLIKNIQIHRIFVKPNYFKQIKSILL